MVSDQKISEKNLGKQQQMSICGGDIDLLLIEFLAVDDLRSLYQVNKFYWNLIRRKLQVFHLFFGDYNQKRPKSLRPHNPHNMLIEAIKYGKVEICEYICSKYGIDIHYDNEEAFRTCCSFNLEELAQWLYSRSNFSINIRVAEDLCFSHACLNGNLKMAKWLLELDNTIDTHGTRERALRYACEGGHLNVIKWLFEISSNRNIYLCDGLLFRNACEYGELKLVKLLYGIDENIDVNQWGTRAFYMSLNREDVEIAKFMFSTRKFDEVVRNSYPGGCYHPNIVEWLTETRYALKNQE
jgi:hypothetical protein